MGPSWGEADREFHHDVGEPASPEARSLTRVALTCLGLVIVCLVAAFSWYERELITSWLAPPEAAVAPEANSVLKNLQAFQLQTTGQLNQITQDLAAAQADLKKLSDQLSALTARVDMLQNAAAVPSSSPPDHPSTAPVHAKTTPGQKPVRPPKSDGTVGAPVKLGPD
jgi:uncharacterized coiled-coil protein SlyX